MRIAFFGSGEFAVPCLRWLSNSDHEIVAVVTQPPRPAGRGRKAQPTPIASWAEQLHLSLLVSPDVNEPAFRESLATLRGQLAVVIDFGQKLREPLRLMFPSQCINVHGSLLPKYRGAAPVVRALLAGEKHTGVTVFRLVERMDAGPILVQRETQIGAYETAEELHDRLAGIGCDALGAALQLFAADPLPQGRPQDETQATTAPKLSKLDGQIQFTESAELIARQCRALWPWPGARCRYVGSGGKSVDVTLMTVSATPVRTDVSPGTITEILTVATGQGTLEIHTLQPAGGRPMGWQDFVNGRHVRAGDCFESQGA